MKRTAAPYLFIALLCLPQFLYAQQDTTSLKDVFSQFSLRDLLNVSIVTVSKQEEKIFDAPLASSVLTGDEIKAAGATSLMEALRLMPGIIVREQTPGNYDIHIRGFDAIDPFANIVNANNTVTLVMINNRIVYNDQNGGTFWDALQIGIDDIDRIEAVRGAASALYGANAATGVINIITKKPAYKKGFYASAYSQAGNFNTALLNGAVGYSDESGFGFRVSGNFDNRSRHQIDYFRYAVANPLDNDIILVQGGFRSRPDSITRVQLIPFALLSTFDSVSALRFPNIERAMNRYSFNGQLSYQQSDVKLNLFGGYASSRIQRTYQSPGSFSMNSEENTAGFGQFFGSWQNLTFNIDASGGLTRQFGIVEFNFLNANLNADYNIAVNDNFSIKPGMAYRFVLFTDPVGQVSAANPSSQNYTASLFARAEYFTEKWRYVLGLRYDFFRVPGRGFFSPQAIVTFKPNDDVLLRGSYGRSARSPFITSIFGDIEPTPELPFQIRKNDNYQFLTFDAFEAGARFNLSQVASLDVEGFYTLAQNFEALAFKGLIADPRFGTIGSVKFENTEQRVSQLGATLALTVVPSSQVRVQGFVTVQQTRSTDFSYANPTPLGTSFRDSSFTNGATPTAYGGLIVNYRPVPRLNLNVSSYFYSAQTLSLTSTGVTDNASLNQFTIDANVLVNAAVSYEALSGVRVFLNGRNLLGGGRRQFGFADVIQTQVLGGINLLL
ncbi:MAG: hypothetical protein HY22_08070 [[Candidatus Thermochlorobacteriaceae] bacterium GBChlB]|nr:MAG: hypothetical protein HY22_08070 [[Candidatus Thermochlorobacteriaceae] bacterium GBChlB]